jgi:hypothetical protein
MFVIIAYQCLMVAACYHHLTAADRDRHADYL